MMGLKKNGDNSIQLTNVSHSTISINAREAHSEFGPGVQSTSANRNTYSQGGVASRAPNDHHAWHDDGLRSIGTSNVEP